MNERTCLAFGCASPPVIVLACREDPTARIALCRGHYRVAMEYCGSAWWTADTADVDVRAKLEASTWPNEAATSA